MRIVFLGSPAEALPVLQALRELDRKGEHQLVGVVTQPARPAGRNRQLTDCPIAQYAATESLTLLKPESAKDPIFLSELAAWKPDVCVTAAYGQILNEAFLATPSRGTINVHPSLLPKYRGATPVPAALLAGDEITGVTVLFTVKALDAGNIICQTSSKIENGETNRELTPRLFAVGGSMMREALKKLADPAYVGSPQQSSEVTHCRKIKKEDGRVNWSEPADIIVRKFRAFQPWPSLQTFCQNSLVTLTSVECHSGSTRVGESGAFAYDKQRKVLEVQTGEGVLIVHRLQPAGSKEMDAASFWNGAGQKLTTKIFSTSV
jgi:methionyl-tRNA formyltransferase